LALDRAALEGGDAEMVSYGVMLEKYENKFLHIADATAGAIH
jgi:aspartate racemase